MTSAEYNVRSRPQLLALVKEVADARMLSVADICSKWRNPGILAGRQEVWYHLRLAGWSYPEIARVWNVAHTTVRDGTMGFEVEDES